MNETPAAPTTSIDLKRFPNFVLGRLEIRPAACEVVHPGGATRLQNRVMQVLVALAQDAGRPVSRELLRERCWSGQVVGEDSISRCIQSLRRLANAQTPPLFRLETIPRIGYRLSIAENGPSEGAAAPASSRRRIRAPPWWALAAPAAAISVVGLIAGYALRRPAPWRLANFERLFPEVTLPSAPALSPNGRLIAFAAGHAWKDTRIFVGPTKDGAPTLLSHGPWADWGPAWSPGGARLAYVEQRAGRPCQIMVVASLGGIPRHAGDCVVAEGSSLDWTRAGDGLYLRDAARIGDQTRIYRLDLLSGARGAITRPGPNENDTRPKLSPDGRRIAFLREGMESASKVWTHDLASGVERPVGPAKGEEGGFAWAEDSRSIFIVGGSPKESELWSYPVNGVAPRLVGGTPLQLGRLSSSAGGLLAAEVTASHDEVVLSAPGAHGVSAVVDTGPGVTFALAYAKDATLALASDRSGHNAIWLKAPNQRTRLLASFGDATLGGLTWSPSDKFLAFVWRNGRNRVIRVLDRSGAPRAAVALPGLDAAWPAWTRDGESLLCPVRDRAGWRIWRVPLGSGERPTPVSDPGWSSVATNGSAIYAARSDQPGIWRLDGGPKRITAAYRSAGWFEGWTIAKNSIIFADLSEKRLWSVPLSGGPARPFAQAASLPVLTDLAVDPVSDGVAYVRHVEENPAVELFYLRRD